MTTFSDTPLQTKSTVPCFPPHARKLTFFFSPDLHREDDFTEESDSTEQTRETTRTKTKEHKKHKKNHAMSERHLGSGGGDGNKKKVNDDGGGGRKRRRRKDRKKKEYSIENDYFELL